MSHTARLLRSRESKARARSPHAKLSRQQESELLHGVAQVRDEVRGWDRASRASRRALLQRFLWLHSADGAGIGAQRAPLPGTGLPPSHDRSEHKERLPPIHSHSFPALVGTGGAGPSSLASASLESLYGAGASLLLMRITSWLRLTYPLRLATTECLQAMQVFVEDAQGGLRFVHELVEAGGILTLLAIIEQKQQTSGSQSAGPDQLQAASHAQQHSFYSHSGDSDQPSSDRHGKGDSQGSSRASQAQASLARRHALDSEREKALSLSILHRISLTGRAFKELICEAKGVGVIIACLAVVRSEGTQQVAKQLLCQLGMGNPRFASLVHEELLSVFRGNSSNSCKRMVLQTLHFLLSNSVSVAAPAPGGLGSSASTSSLHGGGGAGEAFDASPASATAASAGGAGAESFTADARYVDATVALFHIGGSDVHLHYDACALLKLLVSRHHQREAALQALLALLRQKAQNALVSPGSGAGADASGSRRRSGERRSSREFGGFAAAFEADATSSEQRQPQPQHKRQGSRRQSRDSFPLPTSGGEDPGAGEEGEGEQGSRHEGLSRGGRAGHGNAKNRQSDPKSLAVRLLNELALGSYEVCLRLTQLGATNLLLGCLCAASMELQQGSAALLYTLHNNVQESASLIRIMMSSSGGSGGGGGGGGPGSGSGAPDALYRSFLEHPESLHRRLTPGDAARIQANMANPHLASTFLSQRRMERRAQGGSRRGSQNAGGAAAAANAVAAAATAMGLGSFLPGHAGASNGVGGLTVALASAASASASSAAHSRGGSGTFAGIADALSLAGSSSGMSTPTRPQLAPDHPSLRGNAGAGAAGGASASPLTGAFLSAPGASNLEQEDALFFAQGVATIARRDRDDEDLASAAAAAAVEAHKKHSPHRAAAAVAATATSAPGPGPERSAGGTENASTEAHSEDASKKQKKKVASKTAAASNRAPFVFVPHPDAITVPILSLHFDPRLKLAGAPPAVLASSRADAAAPAGGKAPQAKAAAVAAARRAGGVHEGDGTGSAIVAQQAAAPGATGAAATTSTTSAAELYSPFAPPAVVAAATAALVQSSAAAAAVAAGTGGAASTKPGGGRDGGPMPASTSGPSIPSSLVFSQRVGVVTGTGGGTSSRGNAQADPVSEGYLRAHFRDMMHEERRALLAHGAGAGDDPAAGDAAAAAGAAGAARGSQVHRNRGHGGVGAGGGGTGEEDLMLPEVVPHVEVLDGHPDGGGAGAGAVSKREAARLQAVQARAEKRAREAAATAAAAEKFALATKYKRGGGADGEAYEGFTGETIQKQKTADAFSARKVPILSAAEERKQAAEAAAAAAAAASSTSSSGGPLSPSKSPSARGNGAAGAGGDDSIYSHVQRTSNRSILSLAIQLDNTGRTIDPRRWNTRHRTTASTTTPGADATIPAAEGQMESSSDVSPESGAQNPDSGSGAATGLLAPTPKHVLPVAEGESELDRAERLQIEAELASLRVGPSASSSSTTGTGMQRPRSQQRPSSQQRPRSQQSSATAAGGSGVSSPHFGPSSGGGAGASTARKHKALGARRAGASPSFFPPAASVPGAESPRLDGGGSSSTRRSSRATPPTPASPPSSSSSGSVVSPRDRESLRDHRRASSMSTLFLGGAATSPSNAVAPTGAGSRLSPRGGVGAAPTSARRFNFQPSEPPLFGAALGAAEAASARAAAAALSNDGDEQQQQQAASHPNRPRSSSVISSPASGVLTPRSTGLGGKSSARRSTVALTSSGHQPSAAGSTPRSSAGLPLPPHSANNQAKRARAAVTHTPGPPANKASPAARNVANTLRRIAGTDFDIAE